jgi:hypothetical protein
MKLLRTTKLTFSRSQFDKETNKAKLGVRMMANCEYGSCYVTRVGGGRGKYF